MRRSANRIRERIASSDEGKSPHARALLIVGLMQIGRIVLVLVASAVYFGLAVAGWGGLVPLLSHPARVALCVVFCAMVGVALIAGGNVSSGVREDRRNRWVLAVFTVLGLLDGWLPAYTDRIGFWTIDGDALRWGGVALFAAGGALRLWPVFVLGNRFSGLVAIQPGHTLVTDGVYGIIRHPSYLGLLLSALGWAFAFDSGAGVVVAVLLVPLVLARIRAEEALLYAEFGARYEAYRTRTSRLIPHIY